MLYFSIHEWECRALGLVKYYLFGKLFFEVSFNDLKVKIDLTYRDIAF